MQLLQGLRSERSSLHDLFQISLLPPTVFWQRPLAWVLLHGFATTFLPLSTPFSHMPDSAARAQQKQHGILDSAWRMGLSSYSILNVGAWNLLFIILYKLLTIKTTKQITLASPV